MNTRTPLFIIFTTVFLDLVGFGIVIPLISVYGRHFGATPGELAILGAAYSIAQFFFAPFWGSLSDRFGRRPILLMSLVGSTCSYLLFGLAQSYWLILLSRIFAGIFAANISAAQAYIGDITPPEKRASGMGMIGAAFGLGFILGPPIGGLSSAYGGLSAPGFVAASICGLNTLLAFVRLRESLPPEKRVSKRSYALFGVGFGGLRSVLQHKPLGLLLLLFFGYTFAFAHIEQCFALLLQHRFFSETESASYYTGLMLGWSGILGALMQGGLIRRLEGKVSLALLVSTGFFTCALTYSAFPFLPTYSSFYFAAIPLALGGGLISPSISGLISKNTPAEKQGLIFGVSQGFGSLARALAPLSAQIAFGYLFYLPFLIAGLVSICMFLLSRQLNPSDSSPGRSGNP